MNVLLPQNIIICLDIIVYQIIYIKLNSRKILTKYAIDAFLFKKYIDASNIDSQEALSLRSDDGLLLVTVVTVDINSSISDLYVDFVKSKSSVDINISCDTETMHTLRHWLAVTKTISVHVLNIIHIVLICEYVSIIKLFNYNDLSVRYSV